MEDVKQILADISAGTPTAEVPVEPTVEVEAKPFVKKSVTDMKEIIEVIHPNEAIRTYAVTKILPLLCEHGIADSIVRRPERVHPEMRDLVTELLAKPYVNDLTIHKTDIRIEATEAFTDLWDHFHDEITALINLYVFNGEATEIRIRDDRPKYAAARKNYEDWY